MEAQNAAAEIKVRAERRAGEMLKDMEKNKGTRTIGGNVSGGNTVLPPESTTKLNDIGISKMQSSRFQQAASVPEEQFERHIDEKKAAGKPITSSGVAKGSIHLVDQYLLGDVRFHTGNDGMVKSHSRLVARCGLGGLPFHQPPDCHGAAGRFVIVVCAC